MCIAIVKLKDQPISDEMLRNCAENNPDGCGLAYAENNTVYYYKTMDIETFLKKYHEVEGKSNMLLHFRIATHGKVCVNNCHPFKLNDRMVLIHNGVISGYGVKAEKPDTVDFIEKVIGKISWKNWSNEAFRTLVGEAIGSSKFGILDTSGNYYIVNESKGHWFEGNWFSNYSYEKRTYTKYTAKSTSTTGATTTKKATDKSTNSKKSTTKIYSWYEEDEKYKQLYRCKCGHEFTGSWATLYAHCDKCNSYDVEAVGWVEDGKTYYYNPVESYSY